MPGVFPPEAEVGNQAHHLIEQAGDRFLELGERATAGRARPGFVLHGTSSCGVIGD